MARILLLLQWVVGAGTMLFFPDAASAQRFAMREEGELRWVCGGVGFEERAALAELRPQANLELLFVTAPRGGYLADILVTLYEGDADAPVLSLRSSGPICLLHLSSGRYRIQASRLGEHRSAQVSGGRADGNPRRTILAFPEEP